MELENLTKLVAQLMERVIAIEAQLQNDTSRLVGNDYNNTAAIADSENAVCELSEDVDARIADIEVALCELSEQ